MNRMIILIGLTALTLITFSVITDVTAATTKYLKADSVLTASTNIKAYVDKNRQLPNYVTIENQKYSMDQYLYISSEAIASHSKGIVLNDILPYYDRHEIKKANKPSPKTIKANIDMFTVYDMAGRTVNYIVRNNKTPYLIGSKYGDVQFQTAVYAYAKVLDYYKKNKVMPNYVSLNVVKTSKLANYMPNF